MRPDLHNLQPALAALLLAIGTPGCTGAPPAPDRAVIAQPEPAYRLQPGDEIDLRQLGGTEYNAIARVAPDGNISLPGLPEPLAARGLTLPELADRVERRYRRAGLLTAPAVTASLRAAASQEAFIGGEVRRPGLLRLPAGGRTVLQIIMAGGGPLATADLSQTLVYRTLPTGTVVRMRADLDRVLDGRDMAQNLAVQPLDVIIVPQKGIASVDVWVDQYVRQALPVPASVLLALVRGRVPF